MKKQSLIKTIVLLLLLLLLTPVLNVQAGQATSYTYTLDDNYDYIRTQDAYLPEHTITSLGLSDPQDLFIDEKDMLYIVDSKNKRIVKYDIRKGSVDSELTYDGFATPKGIYVTSDGDIYVSDAGAKKVFHFNAAYEFIEEFIKPETPIFADTNFEPMRIAVDHSGNLYLVGEGVYNGIIQLGISGEFLGYFTVNKTRLTVMQSIQKVIFSRAQLENLLDTVPTTFSNIFIDRNGIVYTTTMGSFEDGIKKHNTAGGNMFKETVFGWDNMTDVWVDEAGIIYVSCNNGSIEVYSQTGEMIFVFGSTGNDLDIAGLFTTLPSLAVDSSGNIWAIDGEKGYLQSFQPTDYAKMVYGAMGLYEQGLYEEALTKWTEVLKLNQMSVLAHNGVGKAYLHAQHYEEAMVHFEVAGNRSYYSDAFWEVRNNWIQSYLGIFVALIAAILILQLLVKKLDKKHVLRDRRGRMKQNLMRIPVLGDVLYAVEIPRHPINGYYDIRVHKKGSLLGAGILYVVFFIMYLIYQTSKGFIYQYTSIEDLDINAIVIGFFVILLLFVLCNYLVTSINDGDGNLKQVFMIPAYGSIPALVSMITVTLLSYVLTYNEAFLLTIILILGISWSLVSIFLGLQTVHDYSFKVTIKSLIMTAFFMLIAAVMGIIITIMWEQLWQFLQTVGKEMVQNVL